MSIAQILDLVILEPMQCKLALNHLAKTIVLLVDLKLCSRNHNVMSSLLRNNAIFKSSLGYLLMAVPVHAKIPKNQVEIMLSR